MSLTFEPDGHVYRWSGRVVPSVTQVLDAVSKFAMVPEAVMQASRERGTDVHSICQFYDENDLDLGTVAHELTGYLRAWMKFTVECEPQWQFIEQSFYSDRYGYAGTPDRVGHITYKGERCRFATIDIKTSATASPLWGAQTAAYQRLHDSTAASKRFSVQLAADGTYRLLEWPDHSDFTLFLAALTVRNFCERHKL